MAADDGLLGALRVVTGDVMGLVKVWAPSNARTLVRSGTPRREDRVEALTWADSAREEAGVLAVSRESGLQLLRVPLLTEMVDLKSAKKDKDKGKGKGKDDGEDPAKMKPTEAPPPIRCEAVKMQQEHACTGLDALEDRVVVSSADGTVQVVAFDADQSDPAQIFGSDLLATHKLAGNEFSRMRVSPTSGLLASGGKETLLSLWDMNKWKRCFHAKNVGPDKLDMRIPVWVTDMCFLGGVEGPNKGPKEAIGGGCPERLATCTAHGQVRLYDTRAQRRAVADVDLKTATELYLKNVAAETRHLTTITALDDNTVIVGDAVGGLRCVDLRTRRVVKSFKTLNGSIRSISKHPTLPLICAGGLDRHLVVGDVRTGLVKVRMYARQQLTGILMSANAPPKPAQEEGGAGKKRPLAPIPDESDLVGDFSEDSDAGNSSDDEEEENEEEQGPKAARAGRKSKPTAKKVQTQPSSKRRR